MKGPKDPVDHARTTRPHAGESMKDNKIMPGLVVIGLSLVSFVAALSAFLLWGMASHALGAVQDIRPDREAGIGSIATVLDPGAAAALPAIGAQAGAWVRTAARSLDERARGLAARSCSVASRAPLN